MLVSKKWNPFLESDIYERFGILTSAGLHCEICVPYKTADFSSLTYGIPRIRVANSSDTDILTNDLLSFSEKSWYNIDRYYTRANLHPTKGRISSKADCAHPPEAYLSEGHGIISTDIILRWFAFDQRENIFFCEPCASLGEQHVRRTWHNIDRYYTCAGSWEKYKRPGITEYPVSKQWIWRIIDV